MRKILLALMLCLGALVPVGLTAPPAHAACAGLNVMSAAKNYYKNQSGWRFVVYLTYQHCDHGNIAKDYDLAIVPLTDPPFGCNGEFIDEWHVNPNVIGNYNPGTRNINCSSSETKRAHWDLYDEYVGENAPDNERCLGAHVIVGIIGKQDPEFDLPSLCLPR